MYSCLQNLSIDLSTPLDRLAIGVYLYNTLCTNLGKYLAYTNNAVARVTN